MSSPIHAPDANSAVVTASGTSPTSPRHRVSFAEDFRRFFVRGLAALMPTLITLWLLVWVYDFLWENVGRHVMLLMRWLWLQLGGLGPIPMRPAAYIYRVLDDNAFRTRVLGVLLAVLLVYIVGVFVGNLLGRTAWRLVEVGVMKIPLVRAIYPAVKQITDFVLSERTEQFHSSKVVAVQPHEKGIWSIGLVTGAGVRQLTEAVDRGEMVTVFVPSSPTAFSGYVLVVPKSEVIELPWKVEDAMRLLVSGGVLGPTDTDAKPPSIFGAGDAPRVELPPQGMVVGGT